MPRARPHDPNSFTAALFSSKLCPSPPARCRRGKQAHTFSSRNRNETAHTMSNGLLRTKIDFSPVIANDPNRSPVELLGEKMEVFASLMRTLILGKVSDFPKGTQSASPDLRAHSCFTKGLCKRSYAKVKAHGQKRDTEKSGVQCLQNTAPPKQPHQKLLCSIRLGTSLQQFIKAPHNQKGESR